MRAARLLRILILLQNRGRLSSAVLAEELEVTRRTILRDVDAMTEAGLPIIVHQGAQGGIELGFNYRTRLTGLAEDEAEALGVLLGSRPEQIAQLGLGRAVEQAAAKLIESLPDGVRQKAQMAVSRFQIASEPSCDDPRVAALAYAIRDGKFVTLRVRSASRQVIEPKALTYRAGQWHLTSAESDTEIPQSEWSDIHISAVRPESS